MAIRLDKSIIRGVLTNEVRGVVSGKIWLLGLDEPISLELEGNCLRDLAGCTLRFENLNPSDEPCATSLERDQQGCVGDMSASRKAKIPTVSEEELHRLICEKKEIPSVTANCLYLEWFSSTNGRVVIETARCQIRISEPAWRMTEAEEREQEASSQQNFYQFLDQITGVDYAHEDDEEDESEVSFLPDPLPHVGEIHEFELEKELNEFEWEQELRDADRKAEAYHEALEKYKDHPEGERLIAEAMGWDESTEEDFTAGWENFSEEEESEEADEPWSDRDEHPADHHHPLSRRAMELALRLQKDADIHGLLTGGVSDTQNPFVSVIMHVIALGGKLAAALDASVQEIDPEPGFVIAMLKRGQVPLNEALHMISSIDANQLSMDAQEWLDSARGELFDLRREILDLMKELRTQDG